VKPLTYRDIYIKIDIMNEIEGTEKFFDLLEKSIIGVETTDGSVLEKDFLKLCWFKNKYSNLDQPSLNIFYNNSPLNRNKYKVTYECLCGQINKIHIKKFLSKKTLVCPKCRETEEKRKKHSELLRSKDFKKKDNSIKKMSNEEEINNSETQFNLECHKFKEKYYHRNLTSSEFNQIKDKIVAINGVNIVNKEFTFLPTIKINNQTKYFQYIFQDGIKIPFKNIVFKCDNCDDVFNTSRKPKNKINNYKILCPKCSLCNKTFKIRNLITIFGDKIIYQSKLEKDFIEHCEMRNIKILNGSNINYEFKGRIHKYRVDFYLPEHNLLIEIKANHIWHRKQLECGVWKNKITSVIEYAKENNLTYKILFQEDIEQFFNLLRYSLDYGENHRS